MNVRIHESNWFEQAFRRAMEPQPGKTVWQPVDPAMIAFPTLVVSTGLLEVRSLSRQPEKNPANGELPQGGRSRAGRWSGGLGRRARADAGVPRTRPEASLLVFV